MQTDSLHRFKNGRETHGRLLKLPDEGVRAEQLVGRGSGIRLQPAAVGHEGMEGLGEGPARVERVLAVLLLRLLVHVGAAADTGPNTRISRLVGYVKWGKYCNILSYVYTSRR